MKNLFRSLFISLFPLYALYLTIDGILHVSEHGFSLRYGGRLITSMTVVVLFAGLFIVKRARTRKNLPYWTLSITTGFLISLLGGGVIENNDLIGSSPGFILVLGWWIYLTWYSKFKKRNKDILKVGRALPEFELEDANQEKVHSSSFVGKATVLLFFRGNWCPLCMAQIKEIAAKYKEIEEKNAQVVLISPQPHSFSRSLAKKYGLNFQFLTDVKNQVAKQLHIFAENGIPAGFQILGYDSDTVLPTVVITDASGEIVFADLTDNYRLRPEPETFLKVLDQLN
ncbi:MAG: peroxiredoxin family protein [Bacteroidota bacterium]